MYDPWLLCVMHETLSYIVKGRTITGIKGGGPLAQNTFLRLSYYERFLFFFIVFPSKFSLHVFQAC